MSEPITEEQRIAIEDDSPVLVVRAGAGAGKTKVLVERYLRLVNEGADPDEILTITFTRKAAAEMKDRIVNSLRNAGFSDLALRAQVGPISTVSSFCERILREYPFDAGVDPQFEVLESIEDIYEKCLVDALAERSDDDAVTLIEWLGNNLDRREPNADLSRFISKRVFGVVESFRIAGKTPQDLELFSESPDVVQNAWRRYCSNLLSRNLGESFTEAMLDDVTLAPKKKPAWLKPCSSEEERKAAQVARGMALLAASSWRRLLEEFRIQRVFDFTEMEIRVMQMLEKGSEALASKYRHVLVDEAQDLNPLQHRILQALPAQSRFMVGDPQQSIYRFRGADVQVFENQLEQAKVLTLRTNHRSSPVVLRNIERIFTHIWEDYISMSAGVMDMGETQTESDPFQASVSDKQSSVEIWETGSADERYVVTAQRVIDLIESGNRPRDIAVLMRTKKHVDRIVQELARRGVQCLIQAEGKNYYLRSEIRDFSSLLKSVSNPTDDLALLCSLRSPFVGLSLDAIVLLAIARGDQPLINALEKVQLDVDDRAKLNRFLRWFLPLSLHSEQLPAWRVLADIFAMTQCDARFGLMSGSHGLVANARKLLSLAIQKREMRASEFGKWLSKQTQLRSVSGDAQCISDDADAVRIVTIHKAKGLEWENVVAFIEPSWTISSDMHTAPKELVLAPKDCRAGNAMLVEGARESAEEDQRLLYVALTRAKRRLCIALPSNSKKGSDLISEIRLRLMPKNQPVEGVIYKSLDISNSLRN